LDDYGIKESSIVVIKQFIVGAANSTNVRDEVLKALGLPLTKQNCVSIYDDYFGEDEKSKFSSNNT